MTHWEEIHGFQSPAEYDRFVRYSVMYPRYGKGMIFGGRWFEHIETREIWRLVAPDFPFRGLWERVIRSVS